MLIAHRIHIGDVVGAAFRDDPVFCRFHIRKLRAVAAGEVQRFLRIDDYTGRFGTGARADSRPAGKIIRPAGFVVSVFVDDDRIFWKVTRTLIAAIFMKTLLPVLQKEESAVSW